MKHWAAVAVTSSVLVASGCSGDDNDLAAGPTPVAGNPPSPTASPERAAAEAFVALSANGPDRVPWADRVTYSIAGKKVTTFIPGAEVPANLNRCPPGDEEFDGHTCPISPLDYLAEFASRASVEKAPPKVYGCNRFTAPKTPARLASVSIRPPEEERSCFTDFVVTLYVNGAGKVEWLDFALSGP